VELFSKDYIFVTSSINPIFHNWGDDVSIRLIKFINPDKKIIPTVYSWNIRKKTDYLCVGSIITWMTSSSSIIWGSGVVYPEQYLKNKPTDVLAVRGPLTRKYLLDNGINCPEIYGDPALLFPRYYMPSKTKKYKLGVVPHFRDKNNTIANKIIKENNIHFIDVQKVKNWNRFIDEINQCDFIISSSLHGIIIADAYMIPNLWVEFKDGEKKRFAFRDYMLSVSRNVEIPFLIDENYAINDLLEFKSDWHKPVINLDKLLSVCPFN
jgi:pyruvyltransferase